MCWIMGLGFWIAVPTRQCLGEIVKMKNAGNKFSSGSQSKDVCSSCINYVVYVVNIFAS